MAAYSIRLALIAALLLSWTIVPAAERGRDIQHRGAAVSNPAALVRFQDIRYRYFALDDGREARKIEAEGAFTPIPRVKITHTLRATETDVSGATHTDFEEFFLRGIVTRDAQFFGRQSRYFLGLQWEKDFGDFTKGTGRGSDRVVPLGGVTWKPTEDDFFVAMALHSRSYRRDEGAPKVRATKPRFVYIRTLRFLQGWLVLDWIGGFDHQDGDNFSSTLEIELGSMLTPNVGIYGEIFAGNAVFDTKLYESGIGLAVRVIY